MKPYRAIYVTAVDGVTLCCDNPSSRRYKKNKLMLKAAKMLKVLPSLLKKITIIYENCLNFFLYWFKFYRIA